MSEENKTIADLKTEEKTPFTTTNCGNASNSNTFAKADEKLIEFVSMYTHGLVNKMVGVQMCLLALLLVCGGSAMYTYLTMQDLKAESAKQAQLIERMDKRHWELSKVIELSQERSAKKKAETGNGKEQTTLP